jgi:hypothetical protein
MDPELYKKIKNSSASRESRFSVADFVLENPELTNDLITVALDLSDPDHFRACWILEIVAVAEIERLAPRLDDFCTTLPLFINDSAMRAAAKICMLAARHHAKLHSKGGGFLSDAQLEKITETCMTWAIGNDKVAAKAYGIRALYETGKFIGWVYPELRQVLEHGFTAHSPAYRAAAKDVLRKINK